MRLPKLKKETDGNAEPEVRNEVPLPPAPSVGCEEQGRIIYISGIFDEPMARSVVCRILSLEIKDPTKDILMFIDSYGGAYDSFIAIHDVIRMCRCEVATVCIGKAMSAGQLLLMSGTKGKRFITPNSRVLIHQIASGAFGKITHMDNEVVEVKRLQSVMESLILKYTKISKAEIKELMSKDSYITAERAKKLGIVDHIIESPQDLYPRLRLS